MKILKFYKIASLILLILNLLLLGFIFLHKPAHRHGPPPLQFKVTEQLKLDSNQNESFLNSAEKHVARINEIDKDQADILRVYFSRLYDNSQTKTDSIFQRVISLEQKKIEATYNHLAEVKGLLREDQFENFEAFINHMLNVILGERKKIRRLPKD